MALSNNTYIFNYVLQMFRANVLTNRMGPAIGIITGIYVVMVRKYIGSYLSPDIERDVKAAIKAAGGVYNVSGVFLKTTSDDTVVNSKTGINGRSVAYIPRSKVAKEVLKVLDECSHA